MAQDNIELTGIRNFSVTDDNDTLWISRTGINKSDKSLTIEKYYPFQGVAQLEFSGGRLIDKIKPKGYEGESTKDSGRKNVTLNVTIKMTYSDFLYFSQSEAKQIIQNPVQTTNSTQITDILPFALKNPLIDIFCQSRQKTLYAFCLESWTMSKFEKGYCELKLSFTEYNKLLKQPKNTNYSSKGGYSGNKKLEDKLRPGIKASSSLDKTSGANVNFGQVTIENDNALSTDLLLAKARNEDVKSFGPTATKIDGVMLIDTLTQLNEKVSE